MENGKKATVNFGGIGTILAIVFMVLKLTGNLDWPWVWVFAPIWIPVAVALLLLVFYGLAMVVIAWLASR